MFLFLSCFNIARATTVWTCESQNGTSVSFNTKVLCESTESNCKTACKESGTPLEVEPIEEDEDNDGRYNLLAPLKAGDWKLDYIDYSDPTSEDFVGGYLNKMFLLAIGVISAIAVVMLIIAGIQYMGEDSIFGKGEAKKQMTNSLWGLLIALGAFALLNTISPDLIGGKGLSIKRVSATLDGRVHGDTKHQPIIKNGEAYYCGDGKYKDQSPWFDDQTTRNQLEQKDFIINHENCVQVGDDSCTSVYGLNIRGLLNLKARCPECKIIITGGTECWLHSQYTEHLPGNNIVDLSITTELENFIEKGAETREDELGTVFIKDEFEILRENNNHYHVVSW